jgi:hypothetical protein
MRQLINFFIPFFLAGMPNHPSLNQKIIALPKKSGKGQNKERINTFF